MQTIIEKETPSPGGWEKSKFEVIAEFGSYLEAKKFLEENSYTKAGDKFDMFWNAPGGLPWDRYRIKPSKA